jgi:hypothetical protein
MGNSLPTTVFLEGIRCCNRIKSSQGEAPWNPRKEPLLGGCRGGTGDLTAFFLSRSPPQHPKNEEEEALPVYPRNPEG